MFTGIFDHSIIKNARDSNIIKINFINIRDFGIGRHRTVDDKPYGGGTGMILRVDVLHKAVSYTKKNIPAEKVILLDPKGKTFTQEYAEQFSRLQHLILICGHYEGFDERILNYIDSVISIGDYVLSGGEIPAMVVTESVSRLVPGVLRKEDATTIESFSQIESTRLLEYPQYTRPRIYRDVSVPDILLSGHKKNVDDFRFSEALKITKTNRPDLFKKTKPVIRKKRKS